MIEGTNQITDKIRNSLKKKFLLLLRYEWEDTVEAKVIQDSIIFCSPLSYIIHIFILN